MWGNKRKQLERTINLGTCCGPVPCRPLAVPVALRSLPNPELKDRGGGGGQHGKQSQHQNGSARRPCHTGRDRSCFIM